MKQSTLSIRFCGIAGDGVVTAGKILAGACASIGMHVMVNDIYSAEIRGLGKSTTTVRFSSSKIYSMGDQIDLLVGMAARESISEIPDVVADGHVMYDSNIPGEIKRTESLAAHIPMELNGFGIPIRSRKEDSTMRESESACPCWELKSKATYRIGMKRD